MSSLHLTIFLFIFIFLNTWYLQPVSQLFSKNSWHHRLTSLLSKFWIHDTESNGFRGGAKKIGSTTWALSFFSAHKLSNNKWCPSFILPYSQLRKVIIFLKTADLLTVEFVPPKTKLKTTKGECWDYLLKHLGDGCTQYHILRFNFDSKFES